MKILAALTIALAGFTAATLHAAPRTYVLEADQSEVNFAWDFGADEIKGKMPVASANLVIDFEQLGQSQVDVAVNVAGAEAGFPFATDAMKGPRVLDAANFPLISFVSTGVQNTGNGTATITGNITVRGETRPMQFAAEIYRQRGTEANDLSHLVILLTGALNRSDFGATGWSDLAGDEVRLRILASIAEAG
jgi:polyisoprenoid-binding protein YceI